MAGMQIQKQENYTQLIIYYLHLSLNVYKARENDPKNDPC